ncbi:MAG: FKBP-type peptidyl-prolyl cis-trans isomerase [Saprospiraceae bacterium]|nr:FKBP-type peptidyl-prolyl cis-trans isomerase [Saprospiraceae bacterium]
MKKLFFAVFFLLVVAAVQAQNGFVTEHGYRMVNHTNGVGMRPQRGESALCDVQVYAGNVLVNTSKKLPGGVYKYDIMDANTETDYYPPMHDALLLMVRGDSATVYQAIDSTMRKFLPPPAKKATEMRFEIKLLSIIGLEAKAKAAEQAKAYAKQVEAAVVSRVKAYRSGLLDAQIKTLPSGLKIYIEQEGTGEKIKLGEPVQVHYFGVITETGVPFDNSYERREPLAFPAGGGQMIAGFDEGIMQLRHGSKAFLFMPWHLAYGDQDAGNIKAKTDLTFFVDVQ